MGAKGGEVKRTPLHRRTPLKRGKPPESTAPRPTPRRGPRKSGAVYGKYHEWARSLPCLLQPDPEHRCIGGNTAHHVKSVGAGGKDFANEVPLCCGAHVEVHTLGRRTFEARYGLDLEAEAIRLSVLWRAGG